MIIADYDIKIEVPEEKKAVIRKLDTMRQHEWKELESMGTAELDALQAEVEGANVPFLTIDHPHVKAIREAQEKIRKRRSAIRRESSKMHNERVAAMQSAIFAQQHILKAIEELKKTASKCQYSGAFKASSPMRPIDAAAMSDAELADAVKECKEALADNLPVSSSVIGLLKTPEAKTVAGELKRSEEARRALHDSARANLDAAEAEAARRKAEAEERFARNAILQEDLCNIVADLQGRISELESAAANPAKEAKR